MQRFSTVDALLVCAVQTAIRWEESVIDAHFGYDEPVGRGDPDNQRAVAEANACIADYTAWLAQKGKRPYQLPITGTPVSLLDLIKKKPSG